MAYYNPLHAPVHKSQISLYSTLTRALGDFPLPGRASDLGLGLSIAELASQGEQALAAKMVNPHEPIYVKGSARFNLQVSVSALLYMFYWWRIVADVVPSAHLSGRGTIYFPTPGKVYPCFSMASPLRDSS